MALRIRFQDGPQAGSWLDFEDDRTEIRFGRNPATCDVVFPANDTRVSREHFLLRRLLGNYRLVTNRETPVYVDGVPGHDDQIVEPLSELQIGLGGPRILVEPLGEAALSATQGFKRRLPTLHESVQEVADSSSRTRSIALLSLGGVLLAAAGAWAGYRLADARIAEASARVEDLAREASAETQLAKAAFRPIVAGIQASVYVVCLRVGEGDGGLRPMATAWVAAPGVLATNAHVAQSIENLAPGVHVVLRHASLGADEIPVASHELHPGFALFAQLVDESQAFDPLEGRVHSGGEFGACDVALLRVAPEHAARLAAPLTLASAEELQALEPGEAVGMVGFPMEGLIRGGVSVKSPEATFQQGHVTGMTDFLFARGAHEANELLHVNLPAAGGASGSPVFLRSGRVVGVFSAGNSFKPALNAPRIPLGGVNYAQRVDSLRELLDGRADAAAARRGEAWKRDLGALFTTGAEALLIAVERSIAAQSQMRLETLASHAGQLVEPVKDLTDAGAVVFEFLAEHDGPHAVIAAAQRAVDIDALVLLADQPVAVDAQEDYTPALLFEAQAGTTYRIVVLTSDALVAPSTGFRLRIARLVAP